MSNLRFKLANKNDKKFLYFLKNEKEARNNSKNKKIIQYDNHKIWFANFLKNKKNKLIIVSFKKKKLGYVKFEYLTNNLYRTSINIKKQFRGKNWSNEILIKSEKFLRKGVILFAEVKRKNVKSKKTFIFRHKMIFVTHSKMIIILSIIIIERHSRLPPTPAHAFV